MYNTVGTNETAEESIFARKSGTSADLRLHGVLIPGARRRRVAQKIVQSVSQLPAPVE